MSSQDQLSKLIIAQAAGTLLDVRFQVEDRVAVFGVAGAGHLGEFLGDRAPLAEQQAPAVHRFESGGRVRCRRLRKRRSRVATMNSRLSGSARSHSLQRPHCGAGVQADVPQSLIAASHRLAKFALGVFVRKDVEQVDVGIGEELTAAVTAGRDDRNAGLFDVFSEGLLPNQLEERVDGDGAPPDRWPSRRRSARRSGGGRGIPADSSLSAEGERQRRSCAGVRSSCIMLIVMPSQSSSVRG